jgi:hypothetical protein
MVDNPMTTQKLAPLEIYMEYDNERLCKNCFSMLCQHVRRIGLQWHVTDRIAKRGCYGSRFTGYVP